MDNTADPKSRTQKKKDAHELQLLGEKLVSLSEEELKELNLPQKLQTAILDSKTLNRREALRRQLQHIGALMRKIDPEPIKTAVESSSSRQYQKAQEHKRIEILRDGLISGEMDLQTDVMQDFPNIDRQHLSQLIRNARKEAELKKSPKSARILFRFLRDLPQKSDL